jgi:hypothetical protein
MGEKDLNFIEMQILDFAGNRPYKWLCDKFTDVIALRRTQLANKR